ncbi:MAG TPA: polymorphic toxin type 44 domain-containing protein [Anaerolineae bacterium]|nr:polymorphic toxin type 44 domain-containing protein [Anaerolineae bacterium]
MWLALWVRRVADDHTWDFKDQIYSKLGDAVMLRRSGDAYGWYEYSVPGNINFGYAGRAAGFPALALHLGASFAEITDLAHKEGGEATCLIPGIPDGACPSLLEVYLNPEWQSTLYDNPPDWGSVEFGVQLWEQHPVGLTLDQLASFLSDHMGMLAGSVQRAPSNAGEYRDPQRLWPYRRGYFNGPRSDPWPFG